MKEVVYDEGEIEITPLRNDDPGVSVNVSDASEFSGQKNPNAGERYIRKPFRPSEPSVKVIYTDGGSRFLNLQEGRKSIGAWAFYDDNTGEIRGNAEENATNNQMELMAVMKALLYLDELGIAKDQWVTIKLDSDYVRLGILFWIKKWIANNWKRTNRDGTVEEVKNRDLWERIHELASERKIFWEHVPAHSGLEGNEKVDIKCGQLIQDFMDQNGLAPRKVD